MDLSKVDEIIKVSGIEIIGKANNIKLVNIPYSCRTCGIYIITTLSKKSYIGSSTNNVGKRSVNSSNFLRRNRGEHADLVDYYITKHSHNARTLESLLIRELCPELNERGKKRSDKGAKMVLLKADAYIRVIRKQMEIFLTTKKRLSMQDIVAKSVIKGIDLIDIPVLNGKEIANGKEFADEIKIAA